MPEGYYKV